MTGSITAYCVSESQNRFAIATSVLQTAALSHKTKTAAAPLCGTGTRRLSQT